MVPAQFECSTSVVCDLLNFAKRQQNLVDILFLRVSGQHTYCKISEEYLRIAAKTHRELFSDFYANLMREPLEKTLAENPRPFWSVALFGQMMRDLSQCNGHSDPVSQVCFSY